MEKKCFLLALNVMILQTIRIKCVRFGGHVDKEVSYKIFWLEILKFAEFTLLLVGAILRLF